jgi:hypothetical protein
VVVLYDRLPADFWPGGKPTLVDQQGLAEALTDIASSDLQQSLTGLRRERDPRRQGEAARAILRSPASQETLRIHVEAVVQQAQTPQMSGLDPVTVFATVVAFAAMPEITRDEKGKWRFAWNPAGNLSMLLDHGAVLVEKLTAFMKSLPGRSGGIP